MQKLSVTIITRNEENNIRRCISSVKEIASEIVVVDSLSTDKTADICREMGCRVVSREFSGYGETKQFAVDLAENDWILSLDADEELSGELASNIQKLLAQDKVPFSGYRLLRRLVYMGKIMRHSGLGHEYILRLFNRKEGKFTTVPVHEEIKTSGQTGLLKGEFYHYSYSSLESHIEKTNRYTSFAAKGYLQQEKKFSKAWVALKFPVTFFTVYLIKGGILDGYPGFLWSFFTAFYGSLKIAKTIELQK